MNIHTTFLAALIAVTGVLILPGHGHAQDSQQQSAIDTSRVYQLDEVIVSASRYAENPSTVGRNVSVITRQQIEQSVFTSVGDILADQQSLHIIGNNQTPGSLTQGFLRNSNSNHFIVMVDGVRISDPSTVNNGIDLAELSLLGVERIEIVRGSHSTLYGSSAIGGVINIITRGKGDQRLNADISTQHGTFGSGSYTTTNEALLNLTLDQGFYADLGVSQQYTDGLDATVDTVSSTGAFNPQDEDDFRKLDLLGKLGYRTSGVDAYLSYRNADQTSYLDQGAFNDDDNARSDFNRGLLGYGASAQAGSGVEIRFQGAYSDLSRDFVNDSSVVNRQGDYDGTYVETNAEGTLWENDLTATVAAGQTRFIAGLEASVQTMNFRNYIYSRSSFGVFEQTTDLESLDLREEIYSGFAHADIGGRILSPALRDFSLVLGARVLDHNAFGTHLTYEVNPKFRLSDRTLIYGAVTSGFNAPSLYRLNTPEQGASEQYSLGNAGLQPEESVSYEVGWKQDLGALGRFNLSLFRTEVDNVIEYVYLWEGGTDIQNLSFLDYLGDTFVNLSEQDINGLEAGVNLQPLPNLSVGASLTLTRSTLRFSPDDLNASYIQGNHVQVFESGEFVNAEKEIDGLTRRPGASATLNINYEPTSRLSLRLNSHFVSSRDDIYYSSALGPFGALDRSEVDGYNLTDLSARYELLPDLAVTGKVGNLFDTDYTEIRGFTTRGRSLLVKVRYRLGGF